MDRILTYDDGENSGNTSISDKMEKSASPSYPKQSDSSLALAMEEFERSIHNPENIPLPVPAPVSSIPLPRNPHASEESEPTAMEICSSPSSSGSKPHSPAFSVSSSADEEGCPTGKVSSSGSSSKSSPHSSPSHTSPSAHASSPKSAASRSRSRSKSVGHVRSHSPSHSRRRRSSDRNHRHHKSSSRRHHSHRSSKSRHSRRSKERSHRQHSHSRSRDRHRHKRRRHSSRSKNRHSPHRSHRHHRSRSPRERPSRRSRSRSPYSRRQRSRSAEKPSHPQAPEPRKLNFKETLRQRLINSAKGAAGAEGMNAAQGKPNTAANPGVTTISSGNVTNEHAIQQTILNIHKKAEELTGVAVPSYYNPAAVNPLKYAETVQKRKLLWSQNKEKKNTPGQWQSSTFLPDQDSKQTAKYRKLMGMKVSEDATSQEAGAIETKQQQQEMFQRQEKEYEFARMVTHTHRGVGLGFQSHSHYHH